MDNGSQNNEGYGSSRRRMLAALGTTSATLAGCMGVLPGGQSSGERATGGGGNGGVMRWPAIEDGELLSSFEGELQRRSGEVSATPDEARLGSQAAVVESDGKPAGLTVPFPDGLDLENWGVSLAAKPESANRIVVEFIAPTRNKRLTTVRIVPDEFTGWFRLDCGYEHKPAGEPDLSDVTAINIIATNGDKPVKMVVDDLRRTKSADNGKALLAFYGGHDSHYEIAAEMLEERGWSAAVPISPRRIGDRGRMDADKLTELRDRGWDICSRPDLEAALPELSADQQRRVLKGERDQLTEAGFEKGARHLFVPDGRMDQTTHKVVRDVHESAFLYGGGCTSIVPPTGQHTISATWGPALYNGTRRHINLAKQYQVLTTLRIPRIVKDSNVGENENRMSLDDFDHLLTHIGNQGLDVITPSDLVDGTW